MNIISKVINTIVKRRSLSFKLLLLFVLAGIAMTLALRFSTGKILREYFQESIHSHLYHYFQPLNSQIGTPPDVKIAEQLSEQYNVKIIIQGPDRHWSSDEEFLEGRPRIHFKKHQSTKHPAEIYESGIYKGLFVIRITNPPYQIAYIATGDSTLPSPWKLLFNTLLALFLVLALLYLLLRRMISPLKQIQLSVKRIGAGELDHRINIKRQDELGELSVEVNAMADDIQNMLEAKQQLLLAISHELRTPITRAKVALSLLNGKENETVKTELDKDLNEMEALVSDLLEAERFNHRHQTLNLSSADINQLIMDTIDRYYVNEPITQQLDLTLTPQLIDDSRLQFVVKNLLSNALKHRKQSTHDIQIGTRLFANTWQLSIEDHGVGIAMEHIPHLTEPFYRVDPSRQRETGGYGLGLYIIKLIVEAHRGELLIESTENIGTKIMIDIPVS